MICHKNHKKVAQSVHTLSGESQHKSQQLRIEYSDWWNYGNYSHNAASIIGLLQTVLFANYY